MPEFPQAKNDILILAGRIAAGVNANPTDFPNPPFDAGGLTTKITGAIGKITARQEAEAALKAAIEEENAAVAEVEVEAKRQLREAESRYGDDAAKLQEIGWDVKAAPKFLAPGQVRNLEVRSQGVGTVLLDWKAPVRTASVGPVQVYRIERHIHDFEKDKTVEEWGVWRETAFETEKLLTDQPRGMEIAYRVVASNKHGDGPPSDTETVVL